jgi:hypothetical protein
MKKHKVDPYFIDILNGYTHPTLINTKTALAHLNENNGLCSHVHTLEQLKLVI